MTRLAWLCALALCLGGCSCSDDGGTEDGDGGTSSGMDGSSTGTDGSTTIPDGASLDSPFTIDPETGCVLCADGECCACNNGEDDDGDGDVDGFDAECTGAYDDDESSFATGIPGDNIDFCQDCFFDGNSGMGDDGCGYHEDCLYTGSAPGMGGGDCFNCDVSATCFDFCRPRTPNGCDCFGCCEVTRDDGSTVTVVLTSTCSLDNIDDEEACPRCVQSPDCLNECGECELCPGKTLEDLPESCYGEDDAGTPEYTCDDGETVCMDDSDCPTDHYCQLGCCLPSII